jgi:hypothetical protein
MLSENGNKCQYKLGSKAQFSRRVAGPTRRTKPRDPQTRRRQTFTIVTRRLKGSHTLTYIKVQYLPFVHAQIQVEGAA